jgi:hypothetical protein
MADKASGLVQGTLDMLILKTLELQPMHGYGIAMRIEQISKGVFQVNPGSLFPAFRRLERAGGNGEQPTREILCVDGAGAETIEGRDARVGAAGGRDCSDSGSGVVGRGWQRRAGRFWQIPMVEALSASSSDALRTRASRVGR